MTVDTIQPRSLGFPERLEELRDGPLEPVEVAVLDSGIDGSHPDLAGRVVAAFQGEEGEDDEVVVREAAAGENHDVFGHGTAVASLIARVAPNARLVDVRVLDAENMGRGEVLVAGLELAVERRSPVVNMSLAAAGRYAADLLPLCDTAYRQGQVIVAAMRNMPLVDHGFPAEITSTVSVDAVRTERLLEVLYRAETIIEFAAAGEEVEVAAAGGGRTTKTGTSFATPVVAGLCALLLGHRPDLRPFEVKTLLKAYAGL